MTLQNYTYDNSIAATKIDNFQIAVPGPTADMALAITRNFQKIYDNLFAEIGVAKDFVGEDPPYNHLLLNGQEVSKTTYADLYKVYSDNGMNPTKFGTPVNNENFVLPDCRYRVSVGANASVIGTGDTQRPAAQTGTTGGETTHTQTLNELVSHTHPNTTPAPLQDSTSGGDTHNYGAYGNSGATGGGQPFNIMQPYVVFTKIVRYAV